MIDYLLLFFLKIVKSLKCGIIRSVDYPLFLSKLNYESVIGYILYVSCVFKNHYDIGRRGCA